MPPDAQIRLDPFMECGRATTTVGYRDVVSGMLIASIGVPAELVERTVMANVSVEIGLSGAGEIRSTACGATTAYCSASKTIALDELVEALLAGNNVHMEEVAEEELELLLSRLKKSVRAVEQAIAVLKPSDG